MSGGGASPSYGCKSPTSIWLQFVKAKAATVVALWLYYPGTEPVQRV